MRAELRLHPDRLGKVPRTGAVESVQEAELWLDEPASQVVSRSFLEWAAHAYWRLITRFTLGLVRLISDGGGDQCVVLLRRPLVLLRFHVPEYDVSDREGSVTWRIKRGLLVSREGRDRGTLRLSVSAMERSEGRAASMCAWRSRTSTRGCAAPGRSRASASGSTRRPSSASTGWLRVGS